MFQGKIILGAVTTIATATFLLITPLVLASDDLSYWSENSIKYKINDKLSFKFAPKIQFNDDLEDHHYWETVQGFGYKLHKNVDVGIYHLYAEEDKTGGNDSIENRLRLEAILKTTFKGIKLSDRNRYEYRTFNGKKSKDRYRNRIQATFNSFNILNHELTPYISNEFFIDFEADEYNKNRAVAGVTKKINDHLKAGVYYMLQSSKSGGHWKTESIIGSKIDISIN